jgi:hypothetical protein
VHSILLESTGKCQILHLTVSHSVPIHHLIMHHFGMKSGCPHKSMFSSEWEGLSAVDYMNKECLILAVHNLSLLAFIAYSFSDCQPVRVIQHN